VVKILIICSKAFYDRIPDIKSKLEENNHQVFLPNCYDNPSMEAEMRNLGKEEHSKFKAQMFKQSENLIKEMDAVLVLNFNKNGIENYIGGATFLEMYDAFRMNKNIYLYNSIPEGMLKDEIIGFNPILVNGNIEQL
jgi:hypothetical protein